MVVPQEQVVMANRVRELIAAYRDVEDLVSIGAYQAGSNSLADEAIAKWPKINEFLRQDKFERADMLESVQALAELANA